MFKRRFEFALSRVKQQKERINAVHDDDLERFLDSIGVLHDIRSGNVRCKFCSDQVNLDNLSTVFPDSGSVSFVCNEQECLRKFMVYYNEI